MCASPPKFLRPLGEIPMMANGGNQTAVTVAVCVQTVTRARRVAFSLPVHRRRLDNNTTAGGVFDCYRSTKPRVMSVVAWWAWRARAAVYVRVNGLPSPPRSSPKSDSRARVRIVRCCFPPIYKIIRQLSVGLSLRPIARLMRFISYSDRRGNARRVL